MTATLPVGPQSTDRPEPRDRCAHCGVATIIERDADGLGFCCRGCHTAHALILGSGLGDFYHITAEPPGLTPDAGSTVDNPWSDLIIARADGLAEITWHIGGLHCVACIWILERLPALVGGVRSAVLTYGEELLRVVFDPIQATAGDIATAIRQLGYRTNAPAAKTAARRIERRDLLQRLAVSGASAMASMHLSMNLYAGELTRDLDPATGRMFGVVAGVVAIPAIAYGAWPFFSSAWAAARVRRFGIDASTALVIIVGTIASICSLAEGGRSLYFDAVTMYIAILLAGRLAAMAAKDRVLRMAGLQGDLLPRHVRRIEAGRDVRVAIDDIRIGDRIAIGVDEIIPCDGVAEVAMLVDNAVLTGESQPTMVVSGCPVYAGATSRAHDARITVTAGGRQSRIGRLLAEATRFERTDQPGWIDRVIGWMTPAVAAVAGLVFIGWHFVDPSRALDQAIAVIMVCCPCAIGLAGPLVEAIALGRAAGRGILIRDPAAIHRLRRIRHAIFDKTGTLTEGRMRVVSWDWLSEDHLDHPSITSSILYAESRARHPAGAAIASYLLELGTSDGDPSTVHESPGQGMSIDTPQGELRIGTATYSGVLDPTETKEGTSCVGVALAGRPIARVRLTDPMRSDAQAMVTSVRQHRWDVHLLSGDTQGAVDPIRRNLGISAGHTRSRQMPEDKAAYVADLAGGVLMVGDGLNDAPALARADVAVGLRGGLATALESCDVVLVGKAATGRAQALAALFMAADQTRWTERALVSMSIGYNLIGIVLVTAGVWGPWICAIAMPASSIATILVAGTCRAFRGPEES